MPEPVDAIGQDTSAQATKERFGPGNTKTKRRHLIGNRAADSHYNAVTYSTMASALPLSNTFERAGTSGRHRSAPSTKPLPDWDNPKQHTDLS